MDLDAKPQQLPQKLTELSQHDLTRLAREMAMDLRADSNDTLATFNLTPAQYERIKEIPFYKYALEEMLVKWNSSLTTPERIRLKSAAMLEEAFPHLGARMTNNIEPLSAQIETAKLFARVAGVENIPGKEANPAERFTITINLGADEKLHYTKDITPTPPQTNPTSAISPVPEGEASATTLQPFFEK